ncbi:unnamed protein product [Mytilus coruscus]|uniref:Uncharacterized protein n=1 Tax=Mytilus coruscus TaxID=42192 RepID=A0A6J8EE98_MYTCO|nr:unnamed protein product [Mytilus coruscus]
MPRATTNAMEGITMWTQNHTANLLGSLDEAHREQVLRQAREDSWEQRQRYVDRLADIRQQRQETLAMKREKKEAKEQRDRAKKEELTQKRYVLGTPNTGKILYVMTGGKYQNAEKLTANLKCVLRQAEDEREERQAVQQVSGQANPLSSFSLQAGKVSETCRRRKAETDRGFKEKAEDTRWYT